MRIEKLTDLNRWREIARHLRDYRTLGTEAERSSLYAALEAGPVDHPIVLGPNGPEASDLPVWADYNAKRGVIIGSRFATTVAEATPPIQ